MANKVNQKGQKIIISIKDSSKGNSHFSEEKNLIKKIQNQKVVFICPICGILSPEISNINVDNKSVEFKCEKCGSKKYYFKSFYKEILNNNNVINYYIGDKTGIWLKENNNQEEKLEYNHPNLLLDKKKFLGSIEIIKLKNKQIKKIIKFNKKIIVSTEKYKNNYIYLKSLKNICHSFKIEKYRDSNDLNLIFTELNNEIKTSDKEIKDFFHEKGIEIERQGEFLLLNNLELNDENIKCISKIRFNQLKDIDLSGNKITNIEPLCNIKLPFLEFLNLSNNQIKNIEPLSEIMDQLKYLFIQNNQIEDIQVLLDYNFPKFEILRLENNKIDKYAELGHFKNFQQEMVLIKDRKDIEEIKKRLNIENEENVEKIIIEENYNGDIILKHIFAIISSHNKIKKLILRNNKIRDPSLLNKIQFNSLEVLDLSDNEITNLKFLKKMKAKKLQKLYLENNYVKDLFPLKQSINKFPNLEYISIMNNNNINLEDPKYIDELKYFKQNKIIVNS